MLDVQQMAAGGPVAVPDIKPAAAAKYTLVGNLFSNEKSFKATLMANCSSADINATDEHNFKLFVGPEQLENFKEFRGHVVCGIIGGMKGRVSTARVIIACMPHNQLPDGHILNIQFVNPGEEGEPMPLLKELTKDQEVNMIVFAKVRKVIWGERLQRGALVTRMKVDRDTLNEAYTAFNEAAGNEDVEMESSDSEGSDGDSVG